MGNLVMVAAPDSAGERKDRQTLNLLITEHMLETITQQTGLRVTTQSKLPDPQQSHLHVNLAIS